jgi:flavodoxin
MPTAAVVYLSATFTTAGLAEEIAVHLRGRGIDATVASIDDCDPGGLADVDYLLLGCWTHGFFVVGQHPDAPWVEFARALPRLDRPRVGLFTTYRILTGSMFARMRRELRHTAARVELEVKARGPHLTDDGRRALDRWIEAG